MGYKCSFLDNEAYGADDVSAAFSRLTTAGVLPYPQADTVAGSLNALTSELVSAGVADFGGCKVSYDGENVTIGAGTVFFDSGVSVTVDGEGIVIGYTSTGEQVYVSLAYEEAFNRVIPQITSALPTGDSVLLARIEADAAAVDMRSFARAKVSLNSANVFQPFTIRVTKHFNSANSSNYNYEYVLPHTDFKYLLLLSFESSQLTLSPDSTILDISSEGEFYVSISSSSIMRRLYIKRVGETLSFYCVGTSGNITFNFAAV